MSFYAVKKTVVNMIPGRLVRVFAAPYVAGDSLEKAIAVADWDRYRRLRGIVAVISNEVRWDRALPGLDGLSLVLTFDSLTPWWARSTQRCWCASTCASTGIPPSMRTRCTPA